MRNGLHKQGEFRSFAKENSRDKYTLKNFRKPIIPFVFITETEAGNARTRGKNNRNVFTLLERKFLYRKLSGIIQLLLPSF